MLDDIFRWYFCLSEIKPVKGINSWGESNVDARNYSRNLWWVKLDKIITGFSHKAELSYCTFSLFGVKICIGQYIQLIL